MSRTKYAFLLVCLLGAINTFAGPGTYYNSIDTNQTCAALKTLLFHLTSSAAIIPYGSVDDYYSTTDSKPSEVGPGNVIEDRYCSDIPNVVDSCNFTYSVDFCGGRTSSVQCYCYNKEHVFPSSWFGGVNNYPMASDMHYVWPADTKVNIEKSNYPLGYVQSATFTSNNGTKLGSSNTSLNYGYNSSKVFEPIDSFKGDFARAYLYVVTRYQDSLPYWPGRSTSSEVLDGSKYPGLRSWILQLCVKWSKMDPPSAFELQRNDAVFSIQGNRNPYIDHPNWVEKVFGVNGVSSGCVSLGIRENSRKLNFTVYPNPATDKLYVKMERGASGAEAGIEVFDVLGTKVISQQLAEMQETDVLDISRLAKGTYIIHVISDGEDNVRPFIKE